MEYSIDTNNVLLEQQDQVESGEYNVTECSFIFSSEYEGLTKKAVFTGEDGTAYLETIVDNKCPIPSEILEVSQVVEIGVYAYDVDNEELLLRYSPEPTQFYIHQGSYKEAQNSTPPTPSEIEQLQAQITTNANNIEELTGDVVDINQDIADIKAEQITQNENIRTNTDNISTINGQIITINADIDNLESTKADKTEIPTKTSDLINDSDFVSDANYVHTDNNFTDKDKAQITTNASNITTLQNTKADRTEIPTKTSQLNNDSGFITKNVDDLANYYKKSETYNKTEIDGKVSSVYKYKGTVATYQDLPSTDLTIGDVYNVEEDGSNYAWTGNSWDKLGGDIDLSEYYTKTQTDSLLSAKANSIDVYTKSETYNKTEVNTLLDDKVDKVQGKGLSTNDFTDSYKNQIEANQTAITNIKDGTTIDSFGDVETALNGKEDVSNKITELTDQSTDTQYPSAKCVYDELEAKQSEIDTLQQDVEDLRGACLSVEGTGTDITLNNTAQARLLKNELSGRTEQEQLTGKNLLDVPSTFELNRFREFLISLEAGSYILSLENWATSGSNGSSVFNIDGTAYSLNNTNKSVNVTINNDINNIYMYSYYDYNSSAGITATFTNLMIRKASVTDASYEPYCGGIPSPNPQFPQQIKNVTGNANVKIQNKNLLKTTTNYNTTLNGVTATTNSDGTITLNGTATRNTEFKFMLDNEKIILKANKNYMIQRTLLEGVASNILIAYYLNTTVGTFSNENKNLGESNNERDLSVIRIFCNTNDTFNNAKIGITVYEGSTATSYVPHQEQNFPFTFAEGQRLMQGTTLEDDGIHNSRVHVIVNGTENWQVYLNKEHCFKLQLKYTSASGLCSHYQKIGATYFDIKDGIYLTFTNTIIISDLRFSSVEDFKSWLVQQYNNGTPVEIEFVIRNGEEKILYNATQQAQYNNIKANASSYDDITYITSTSDELGFDMNAVAVADANKVIDNIDTRLSALESEV